MFVFILEVLRTLRNKKNVSSPYDPLWFSASTKTQNMQFLLGGGQYGNPYIFGAGLSDLNYLNGMEWPCWGIAPC